MSSYKTRPYPSKRDRYPQQRTFDDLKEHHRSVLKTCEEQFLKRDDALRQRQLQELEEMQKRHLKEQAEEKELQQDIITGFEEKFKYEAETRFPESFNPKGRKKKRFPKDSITDRTLGSARIEPKPRLENPYLDAFLKKYGTNKEEFEELLAKKNIASRLAIIFSLGDYLLWNCIDKIDLDWLNQNHPLVDNEEVKHTWQEFLGPETLIQCAICDQPGAVRSGCCAQVLYCGQECADAHWDAHKQQCIG